MNISEIAKKLIEAEFCILTCGAGMSADSGVPTYRDKDGFWRDYPYLKERNLDYRQASTPAFMRKEPEVAWGMLWDMGTKYRNATPHAGYRIFMEMVRDLWEGRAFVVTSNVDGMFEKVGLPVKQILEIHGNKQYLQCIDRCSDDIWLNTLDPAKHPVPTCPRCGKIARPNVIFFDDDCYLSTRKAEQELNYEVFLARNSGKKGIVVEVGAGTEIPFIRMYTDHLGRLLGCPPIRVNPVDDEAEISNCIAVKSGAADFFNEIKNARGSI